MPISNFSFTLLEYRQDGGYSVKIMQLLEPEIKKICKQDKYQVHGYGPDDLAQELRFHLWNKIPLYDPKKGSIKTWAYKTMNRRVKDLKVASCADKRLIQKLISPLSEDA